MDSFSQSADALGTNIELRLVSQSREKAEKWFKIMWHDIAVFESRFSRFLPDSELTHFNDNAGNKTHISKEFYNWLSHLGNLSKRTNGLYNPFVLPALQKNGYAKSITTNLTNKDYSNRRIATINELIIGHNWAMIPKDSALDSGGNGKGYIADILAKKLSDNFSGFSLSIGGDIAICGNDVSGKWNIDVESKDIHNQLSYSNSSANYSIASSGLKRSKKNNVRSHIIDPSNGEVMDGNIAIATVVANNTEIADVVASSLLIGGVKLAESMVKDSTIIATLLQDKAGNIFQFGNGFTAYRKNIVGKVGIL